MSTRPMPPIDELQPHYPMTCCSCGAEWIVRPSLSMQHGINSGHGRCVDCNTFLRLALSEDGLRIESRPHEADEI